MRTHVRVDLSRIAENYRRLRAACPPGGDVLAVVKANAYGHGAVGVARRLEAVGCERFGVACLSEAAELRDAGVQGEIVVLSGFLPGEESEFVARRLTPLLHADYQVARWIEQGRQSADAPLPCHLKVNTGMNRLGVSPAEALSVCRTLAGASGVSLEGISTHLASAEDFEDPAGAEQVAKFRAVLEALDEAGIERPRWTHFQNSAGLAYRAGDGNLARCGLALYGVLPEAVGVSPEPRVEVQPALEWRARVAAIQQIAEGDRVGYSGVFTAPRPMRIASLTVGYGDGYRRELWQGGRVLLHGRERPVVGRISMDVTMVDVSGCDQVRPGDEAIVLGAGITAQELARRCGTIAYEILGGIAARVARVEIG